MSTKVLYIIIFTIFASTSVAQNRILKKFPEGYTPEEVGIKVANRFLSGKHMLHGGNGYIMLKYVPGTELCVLPAKARIKSYPGSYRNVLTFCVQQKEISCLSKIMSI